MELIDHYELSIGQHVIETYDIIEAGYDSIEVGPDFVPNQRLALNIDIAKHERLDLLHWRQSHTAGSQRVDGTHRVIIRTVIPLHTIKSWTYSRRNHKWQAV